MYRRGGLTYPALVARNGYEHGRAPSFQHFMYVKVCNEEITPFHNGGQVAGIAKNGEVDSGIVTSRFGNPVRCL